MSNVQRVFVPGIPARSSSLPPDDDGHVNLAYDAQEYYAGPPPTPSTSKATPMPSTSKATTSNQQLINESKSSLAALNSTRRQSALDAAQSLHDDPGNFSLLVPGSPDDPPRDYPQTCCDKFQDVTRDFGEKVKHGCSRKLLFKRIPITEWLPKYNTGYAINDLVAGITVGLTILPQSIAFANVAGVPPQNGLYSSFFGVFVYTIFGSAYTSAVGPTALQAILTRQNAPSVDFAILLCFFSGLVQLLMGILQLGFVIDFISGPVSVGFTSAAALVIMTTQVKDLLGIVIGPGEFVDLWISIAANIKNTRPWDPVLGVLCILALIFLKSMVTFQIGPKAMHEKSTFQKVMTHTLWVFSVARNIVVVIGAAVAAYCFQVNGMMPFKLVGTVKPGLPAFQPPPFTTVYNNRTLGFMEMANTISSGTFILAILSQVEDIATARVFANGKMVDATQEMLAIGLSCVLTSFVGGYPISGSLSRGAVNAASGVKTTLGGIYTGVLVLLALAFLTPYFFFIPKASLAAVIVMAVVAMVEYQVLKPIWRTKKIDLLPALATFLCCLFVSLAAGIIIGVGINVLVLLHASARPKVSVENAKSLSGIEYLLVTPDRSLVFPSVEYVRGLVSKAGVKQGFSQLPVVVDATFIYGVDYTAAKGIKVLMEDYAKRKQLIVFFNLKSSLVKSFTAVKPKDFKHCNDLQTLERILSENNSKQLALADGVEKSSS